jgi:hypothetical protein
VSILPFFRGVIPHQFCIVLIHIQNSSNCHVLGITFSQISCLHDSIPKLGGDCVIRLRYGKILTFWKLLNGTKIIKFIPIFIPIWFFMLTKHNIWCIFALLCTIFSNIWRIKCFLRRPSFYPLNYEHIFIKFLSFWLYLILIFIPLIIPKNWLFFSIPFQNAFYTLLE